MNKIFSLFITFCIFSFPNAFALAQQAQTSAADTDKLQDVSKKQENDNSAQKEKKVAFKFFKKDKAEKTEDQKREAKTFALFKKREKSLKGENIESKAQKDESTEKNVKKEARQEKKIAKKKKNESKYDEYSIPIDAYMPVGLSSDKAITISGSVQKTLELNLADCLELSLINNPKIKAAYANAEAMKFKKWQTVSNYSPVVNLQGGISRIKPDMSNFRSRGIMIDPFTKYVMGTIGISQLVYDFDDSQFSLSIVYWF